MGPGGLVFASDKSGSAAPASNPKQSLRLRKQTSSLKKNLPRWFKFGPRKDRCLPVKMRGRSTILLKKKPDQERQEKRRGSDLRIHLRKKGKSSGLKCVKDRLAGGKKVVIVFAISLKKKEPDSGRKYRGSGKDGSICLRKKKKSLGPKDMKDLAVNSHKVEKMVDGKRMI